MDDAVVVDEPEPVVDKRPTRPNPPLAKSEEHERLVIDFALPEAAALFLEACARSIREQSRVVLIIERPGQDGKNATR
ncbi:MAG TPA: hypothetical protein VGM94_01120 [Galbitalea sp.]|jgi:hypothetical protein